ncbi:replication-relaxation family protein [Kitasatospora sp. NBC_00039]|uniref:replication-relaxation family protein n=1 Tax=Kitasatospora sp. NBC_00039 TaxID=2903565 RepID=UPI002F90961B
MLAALFQFRIATAEQLRRLRDQGLVAELVLPQSGRAKGWFLAEHGARIAGAFPELAGIPAPRLPGDETAFKYTLWHQPAVLRTHLAFLDDARARGDGYGPFDFIPEVTHRFAEGREGREGTVCPDRLLYYGVPAPESTVRLRAFVEVDRGTMGAERLASKLNAYARYWSTKMLPAGMRAGTIEAEQGGRVPLWERRYTRFPRLLFVLTGTGQTGFHNRVGQLQLHAGDRHVAKMPATVPAAAASLADLEEHGPGGAVWYPLTDHDAEPRGFHELTVPGRAHRPDVLTLMAAPSAWRDGSDTWPPAGPVGHSAT